MKLSPSTFRRAYQRFQAIHVERCGKPLDSFSNQDAFAHQWEGYKIAIPGRAAAVLNARKWSRAQIGKGKILQSVIQAIELPGNNLLQWEPRQGPTSRAHASLYDAKRAPERLRQFERIFYSLYKSREVDESSFESLVGLCGRRYELLGYLFFIAQPGRFLPIRTRSFDKAFAELGMTFRTEGHCAWDNYQTFLAIMRDVQARLRAEGISDASLLDAHSFCWILARHEADTSRKENQRIVMQAFRGNLVVVTGRRAFAPRDDADSRNMKAEAEKRQASGQIAEEIALSAERWRLCAGGRSDLAARVEMCGDRPGLGYDIRSFECDGTARFIEVKNVSKSSQFFLSEGEWLNSQHRNNYWFYLVSGVDTNRRKVTFLDAAVLEPNHLQPVQYVVRFTL